MKKNLFFALLFLLSYTRVSAQDVPDWYNLQWPPSTTVTAGQNSENIYAQVYEPSVTEAAGQGAGILAWIGYGPVGTNPNTWTNWTPAVFNVQTGNNDEYYANIGSNAPAGTYHYASRFQLNGGTYVYGGSSGPWTAPSQSGTLTVNASLSVSEAAPQWGTMYTDSGKIFINTTVKMNLIEVYDLVGRLHVVKERLNSTSAQIPFSRVGIYLVKITAEDGEIFTRKIKI